MNTQISIQVKNENWLSRCMSIYMSLGLFVKAKVNMYIDSTESQPVVLKARKEPYVFDIEPGNHKIAFTAKSKAGFDKAMGAITLGMIGMGSGSLAQTMAFAEGGSNIVGGLMRHNSVKDNLLECGLQEGDILKISIKPKRNGVVKIKLL